VPSIPPGWVGDGSETGYRTSFALAAHSVSDEELIGAGSGEASLAHHEVLFLDELPEFKRMGG
jgi:predicted ATPase with chaperone activity